MNVNFGQWDLQTARLAETIFSAPSRYTHDARLDELTYGRDYWWKGYGPDGPPALIAALIKHGLPWFDRGQSLERQLEHWFDYKALKRARSSYGRVQIAAALTLYRMGRVQDACEVMNKPIPKRTPKESFEDLERVRQWLELPPRTRQQAEFKHPIIRWLGLG